MIVNWSIDIGGYGQTIAMIDGRRFLVPSKHLAEAQRRIKETWMSREDERSLLAALVGEHKLQPYEDYSMPKSTERTSASIASVAGQLLNGARIAEATQWLEEMVADADTPSSGREHAMVLIGTLTSLRRVAASALTQR